MWSSVSPATIAKPFQDNGVNVEFYQTFLQEHFDPTFQCLKENRHYISSTKWDKSMCDTIPQFLKEHFHDRAISNQYSGQYDNELPGCYILQGSE
jgi:hypothetical protein